MNSPTLNKPLHIVSIDPKVMSLSDGSEMQFMPNFSPPKSWQADDVVELEELKMKMYRITNRSQHQTQAQAMCIKGADVKSDTLSITKSMDGEYPKTHHYVEWVIEELLSNSSKMLLSDNSLWELSAAFNAPSRSNAEWSEGQTVEISPISRGASLGRRIQAYNVANKDINLTVTGSFIGFRQ